MHLRGSTFKQRIGIKLQLRNWMIVSCYTRSMSVHEMTGNTPLIALRCSSDGEGWESTA